MQVLKGKNANLGARQGWVLVKKKKERERNRPEVGSLASLTVKRDLIAVSAPPRCGILDCNFLVDTRQAPA